MASDEKQPPLSPVTEDVVSSQPRSPSPEMSEINQEIHLNGDSKEDVVLGDSSDELIDDISAPTSPSLERFESIPGN